MGDFVSLCQRDVVQEEEDDLIHPARHAVLRVEQDLLRDPGVRLEEIPAKAQRTSFWQLENA